MNPPRWVASFGSGLSGLPEALSFIILDNEGQFLQKTHSYLSSLCKANGAITAL